MVLIAFTNRIQYITFISLILIELQWFGLFDSIDKCVSNTAISELDDNLPALLPFGLTADKNDFNADKEPRVDKDELKSLDSSINGETCDTTSIPKKNLKQKTQICDTQSRNQKDKKTYASDDVADSNENRLITASVLEKQVDELYAAYNKIAEALNKPKFEELDIQLEQPIETNDANDKIEDVNDQVQDQTEHVGEESESNSQVDQSFNEDPFVSEELQKAHTVLENDPKSALIQFEAISHEHPTSPGAQYGKAKALDRLAELNRSNSLALRAIDEYQKYIEFGAKINDTQFKESAERCIERMRFMGKHLSAVAVHEKLIERFDNDPYYRNELALTYLLINRLADAKFVLHHTLHRWRDDGFAAVHYGFVLKNLDNDLETAIIFLRQGIESGANGTSDGRFYFNLGDALIRLGRSDEAEIVFKEAADKNLFLSKYQRSLYNVPHLKSRPFWSLAETGYKQSFRILEENWLKIRDEGLSLLNEDGYFTDEAESLRDYGNWKQFELFARGQKNTKNCQQTPFTCKLIETFPAARFCKRGQVKFSVMHPNTHVWPHCGPTNCRLRAHLGLKVPDNTSLRVATETRTWIEGSIMIFDDSFEHEVWHNGTALRLILIIDVWHPDLTNDEKKSLPPI